MEKFLREYSGFLTREYGEDSTIPTGIVLPLLYTEVYGNELYGDGNDEAIGEIQISIDVNARAYVVEVNTYDGKTYRATEVWRSLNGLADDLRYSDFSCLFSWGLSQVEEIAKEERRRV